MNWLDLFAVQGTQESSPSAVVYSYGSHAFFKEVRVSPLRWGRGRVGKHYLEFSVLIFSLPINKSWVFSIVTCLFCLHMLLMGCLLLLFSHSRVWLFATSWTTAHQAFPSFTVSQGLLKLMSIDSVMPSSHLILYQTLLLLPSIFPSNRVFSSESAIHIRWSKYWKFNFSINFSPFL